ncbi:MAG TPA: hypothetical protein VFK34_00350 [Marmoricola sp.]|nr:hypothetical protein [Marmoricola sp.]
MPFGTWPLWLNLLLFLVGAGIICTLGVRLERVVDVIAGRTGLGHALAGLVLLAAATSLPEIATSASATLAGNPDLAVHNLFGTIPANLLILVLADALVGRRALTGFSPRFDLLTEGLGVVVMLALGVMVLVMGEVPGPRVLGWTVNVPLLLLPVAYVVLVRLVNIGREHPRWQPDAPRSHTGSANGEGAPEDGRHDRGDGRGRALRNASMTRLWGGFAALALLVFAAGWLLARLGDSIAQQTGLGGGVVGMLMLAVATSLPEISTTLSAALHGNVTMAISNIFGSCLFDVALLFLPGLLSVGPVVHDARSAVFVAALGITMTTVYLWGLLEHRQRTVFRLGVDSVMVLMLYVVGAVGVVTLQHQDQMNDGTRSVSVIRMQQSD